MITRYRQQMTNVDSFILDDKLKNTLHEIWADDDKYLYTGFKYVDWLVLDYLSKSKN